MGTRTSTRIVLGRSSRDRLGPGWASSPRYSWRSPHWWSSLRRSGTTRTAISRKIRFYFTRKQTTGGARSEGHGTGQSCSRVEAAEGGETLDAQILRCLKERKKTPLYLLDTAARFFNQFIPPRLFFCLDVLRVFFSSVSVSVFSFQFHQFFFSCSSRSQNEVLFFAPLFQLSYSWCDSFVLRRRFGC